MFIGIIAFSLPDQVPLIIMCMSLRIHVCLAICRTPHKEIHQMTMLMLVNSRYADISVFNHLVKLYAICV